MSESLIRKLAVDRETVGGKALCDCPVLVELDEQILRNVGHVAFRLPDGTPLSHEVEQRGASECARFWVRVPSLDGDTVIELHHSDTAPVGRAFDDSYALVLNEGATANVPHNDKLDITDAITVEAWVDVKEARAETIVSLVAKWRVNEQWGDFAGYDAGHTDAMDTTGFFGCVFDGRYIYFAPQHDHETRHGKVLRYDTHGDFKAAQSWSTYDAGQTDGLNTKGYYGAVFDGRYIIFPPRRDPDGFHSRALRYDTQGDFKDSASWFAYDIGVDNSSQSAAFDGRYIYMNPGQRAEQRVQGAADDDSPKVTGMSAEQVLLASGNIIRYDTQGDFKSPENWTTYDAANTGGLNTRDFDGACFDGRHIYFAPLAYAAALRYDTHGDFHDQTNWQAYDCAVRFGMKRNVGAIFDGRYVYYVPYGACPVAVRYDTQGDFTDDSAWQAYELNRTGGITIGYDGAFFDGRFIYYIPYWNEDQTLHGVMLRYDTTRDFNDPASWSCHDATHTDGIYTGGFNGGASDGRYLYCAAWMQDEVFTGRIGGGGGMLRYDTTGDAASFDLRFCDLGHNGGLCAALPGARFLVNTDRGPISIAANQPPQPGRHHVAGVYDGQTIRLYIDGELVNEQPASGRIVTNDTPISIGDRRLAGRIHAVRVSRVARSQAWLRTHYNNLRDPAAFCRVMT
jgi:hypothetical protein